eukprot:scaffold736_cov254-Pinguiococcus_pyrenoidosus.AAC.15
MVEISKGADPAKARAYHRRARRAAAATKASSAAPPSAARDPFDTLVRHVRDAKSLPFSRARMLVATLVALLSLAVRRGFLAPEARLSTLARIAQLPARDVAHLAALRGGEEPAEEGRKRMFLSRASRAASVNQSASASGNDTGVRGGAGEPLPAVRRLKRSSGVRSKTPIELPREAFIPHVFPNNEEWRQGKLLQRSDYFHRFKGYHKPQYLWIGCSDARVPADVIMGEDTGQVFVHRNIANQVRRGTLNWRISRGEKDAQVPVAERRGLSLLPALASPTR